MSLLKEVGAELIGMFFGDARLTIAILLLIAVAVFAIRPYCRTSPRMPPSATATTIPSL